MGFFSMKLENLQQLFVKELRDIYDAEQQITEALPKMIEGATVGELKDALQEHLDVTREQISRLDRIFAMLQQKASGETCKGMKGIINEGSDLLSTGGGDNVIDAGIISAAQKVEHYEIAAYGTVRTYAELLGKREIAQLLQQTLEEETDADSTLTNIASNVNIEAKAA
jgi:ferritin-like metal-binding protein YciE